MVVEAQPPTTVRAGGSTGVRLAAQAYAGHLLAGGVMSWPEFLADGEEVAVAQTPPAWSGEPPGATQAELLRRLNRRSHRQADRSADRSTAAQRSVVTSELGERVLRRAAPGRGRVDLRLTDPPVRVPVAELLRVGAGVLADLVTELGPAGRPGPSLPTPVQRRRRAPSYRLEGPVLTVAALRRRLVAAGLPPQGGRRLRLRRSRPDVVLVVALPLRRALFEVWSRRTQRGGTRSWAGTLTAWRRTRRLPAGSDHAGLAAGWAGRVGAGRVHVVTGEDLDGQVAAVLGGRPAPTAAAPRLVDLPPVLVEVVRRTSEVLTFRVRAEEKPLRLERLVALLDEAVPAGGGRRAPRTPAAQRRWLRRTGRRAARHLRAGGYVVHGPLAPLARAGAPPRPARVEDRRLLVAMLEAVLTAEAARAVSGGRPEGAP